MCLPASLYSKAIIGYSMIHSIASYNNEQFLIKADLPLVWMDCSCTSTVNWNVWINCSYLTESGTCAVVCPLSWHDKEPSLANGSVLCVKDRLCDADKQLCGISSIRLEAWPSASGGVLAKVSLSLSITLHAPSAKFHCRDKLVLNGCWMGAIFRRFPSFFFFSLEKN